jgi:hypothetical protein
MGATGGSSGPQQISQAGVGKNGSSNGTQTYLKPLYQMDEHTDWVNKVIYLDKCKSSKFFFN